MVSSKKNKVKGSLLHFNFSYSLTRMGNIQHADILCLKNMGAVKLFNEKDWECR